MKEIYKYNNDRTYEDFDAKNNITRVIDVCEKSSGKIVFRCYNKQMNTDGEFDAMAISIYEIIDILKDLGYVVKKGE